MKARIFTLFVITVALALGLAWAVAAQGPEPPVDSPLPSLPKSDGIKPLPHPLTSGDRGVQGINIPAVALGQPGLSFRYVQTFGEAEVAYISTTTHLNYPYGVGAQDNSIWIGELIGRRALKYNADGVNQAVIGRAGWIDNPGFVIQSVFDVAADDGGNIWVVDGQAHHVLQFDAGGNFVKELGKAWQEGSTNDRFGYSNGIAFDSQGNIYVSDGGDWWTGDDGNQRVQVFDSSGNYTATLGTTGTIGQGNNQFHGPAHIAIYNDYLYVADRGNHRVQIYQIVFSPSFTLTHVATLGQTGEAGDDDNHFDNPSGVAVDTSYIYVADTFNHRVQVFNRTSRTYVATIGDYGSGNGELNQPYDVAVDASGNLYVADFWNSRVQQFRYAGGTTWNWRLQYGVTGVPYVTDNSHFFHPQGVDVAADGSIYIAENYGRRLVKLTADGTPQWSAPSIPGLLGYSPNDVAIGQDGRVYLVAGWENRIRIYNPDGTLYLSFGEYGNSNYQFDDPQGIGVAPNGDIYVADRENHRVQIYAPDWSYKATMGVNGQSDSDNAHFNGPTDVAVDRNGHIYVADEGNDRVQVFNSNRQYVRTIGETGVSGNDFGHFSDWGPHRLAVDKQNRLYVADTGNNRIQVFDDTGAYLTTIGGGWGNHTGQLRGPFGVAIGSDGAVYIADNNNHRIQKFAPGVPGWVQTNINGFGERANRIGTLAPFGGYLYAGIYNFSNGAQLWRATDGLNWTPVITNGFDITRNVGVDHLIEFSDTLYAGTWADSVNGGEVWRSSNGLNWTRVVSQGFGDPTNAEIFRFAVFSDTLYASTWSYTDTHGAEIWRSSNGLNWTQVVSNGLGDATNSAGLTMEVFNGALYAGTYNWGATRSNGGQVWRTSDGVTWTRAITGGFGDANNYAVSALEVFNGYLYAGLENWDPDTSSSTGGKIYRCSQASGCDEVSDWEKVIEDGFGNPQDNYSVSSLLVFDNHLYAAIYNYQTGMEIWRTAGGTHWEQVGFAGLGNSNNYAPYCDNGLTVFDNRLYIGTANWVNGGEVWKKTVTADFTASPTSGPPPLTVIFTDTSAGDYTSSLWDLGDGITSAQTSPTHTYTASGFYTVTLTVGDGVDTNTLTRTAYIDTHYRIYLPLVLRAYNPLLMLYDDFDASAFDGFYNPVKWQFWGDSQYFSAQQQGGAMVITNTLNSPSDVGLDLPLAQPLERTLRQIQQFEARLKLSNDTSGTGTKIQIMAGEENIDGHGWWTQCSLNAYDGNPPDFGCDVTTYTGSTYTQEYGVGWPDPLNFDTWYTARIEIAPDTAQVCFYLDDNQLGCHVPDDADALEAATNLVPRIGSWNGNAGATGSRFFDEVQITPP